jgi:phenylpyruvate tautomerase PptA (4-oxalocrotonate tautomerase family)
MPIVEVELIGAADAVRPERLAEALGAAMSVPPGSLWLTLRSTPATQYCENGGENGGEPFSAVDATLPVFVRVLARHRADAQPGAQSDASALRIAEAVAALTGRPRERVHVIFEPDARGRVYFGGLPDPRDA